jgi:polysaccharide export outer membrane protein
MKLLTHVLASFALPLSVSAALVTLSACGGTVGPYTWVAEMPAPAPPTDFVIRESDTVNVRVYNQDAISTHEHVRPDGKIVIPMAGEIMVRGRKPTEIAKEIEVKLKAVVVAPVVTVGIDPAPQLFIPVIGEVKNAGTFTIDAGSSVLVALADAGGLSDYASSDRIFVLRKGLDRRVRFRLDDLRAGDARSVGFGLQAGDVVVVE